MVTRKATMGDIQHIHQLINDYAREGLMLRRPLVVLYEQLRDFTVAVDDEGNLLGVGALHVLWHDLAEVRAMAVRQDLRGSGVGRMLVESMLEEAKTLGLKRVFTLTYAEEFFRKCGFEDVRKDHLPQKVWKECIFCDNFECCDEIALIYYLVPQDQIEINGGLNDPEVEIPNWVAEATK